jgi:hypothetical protein
MDEKGELYQAQGHCREHPHTETKPDKLPRPEGRGIHRGLPF